MNIKQFFSAAALSLMALPALADAAAEQPSGFQSMLPLLIIIVVFYFMLIRPQMKRNKEHRKLVDEMAVGDEVVTNGGLLGKISKLNEQFVQITISQGVDVSVQKQAIANLVPKGTVKAES